MNSKITASFEVCGGTAADAELDVTNMSAEEIAAWLEANAKVYVGLCHECGHRISDPQVGELTGFSVDGRRHYGRDEKSGRWVEVR